MHFDVSGLRRVQARRACPRDSARRVQARRACPRNSARRVQARRACPRGPARVEEKPPICRFFDRPRPPNSFDEARSGEQNSLDCRGLEGSGDRYRGLNPLARRLAISVLSSTGGFMKKRMILTLIGMAAFIAVIGAVKYRQVQAGIAQHAAFQPPPQAVTTVRAREDRWPSTVASIGTVEAVHGVTVAADLPGLVSRIEFDSGRKVKAGDVIVRLDTRQEQAQLVAAESQHNLSSLNFERMRGLREKGITSQPEFDRAAAEQD